MAAVLYAIHVLVNHPRVTFPPVKLPLSLFCLATVVSVFFAANPTAGWLAVRKLVLFVIILLAANLVASRRHLEWLYRVLFVEAAAAGGLSVWQFVTQYRAVRALHPHEIYRYMTSERIHGFQGHWMNFGGQQMLIFAVLLAMLLLSFLADLRGRESRESGAGGRESRSGFRVSGFGVRREEMVAAGASSANPEPRIPNPVCWWLLLAVVVLSIVLNFTRGVWLGCAVATLYLVARWRPRWLWALPLLVVAAYFASPGMVRRRVAIVVHPSRDPSLSLRLEMWGVGLRMIERHPWVGVGPDNITEVYTLYLAPGEVPEAGYREHLHDNFLQLAAERGLPCLAAWLWFMVALAWYAWKIARQRPEPRWIAEGAVAAWLAFVVEGFFEFNFGTSPVLMLFLFVVSTPFVVKTESTDYADGADEGRR